MSERSERMSTERPPGSRATMGAGGAVPEKRRDLGLHVEVVGGGDRVPLLVPHGGPGLHHAIYRPLDRLAADRQVVYWDHRGHGRSAPLPEGPVPMSLFADDAAAVASELGIERFAVFGHSFGGWVAQELVLRHRERVTALILASTTPGQLGATESADDDQGPPLPDELAALLARQPATDEEAVELYSALAPHFLRTADPSGFLAALRPGLVSATAMVKVFDALSRWSAVDRLHTITCPALVLVGRNDLFCSVQQAERIARRVPGAELVVFEDTGHFLWEEDPGRFFPLVSAWLRDNAG